MTALIRTVAKTETVLAAFWKAQNIKACQF